MNSNFQDYGQLSHYESLHDVTRERVLVNGSLRVCALSQVHELWVHVQRDPRQVHVLAQVTRCEMKHELKLNDPSVPEQFDMHLNGRMLQRINVHSIASLVHNVHCRCKVLLIIGYKQRSINVLHMDLCLGSK